MVTLCEEPRVSRRLWGSWLGRCFWCGRRCGKRSPFETEACVKTTIPQVCSWGGDWCKICKIGGFEERLSCLPIG